MPTDPRSCRVRVLRTIFGAVATAAAAVAMVAPAPILADTGTAYLFTHLAGPVGGWGNADGGAKNARFFRPTGVAVDGAGNIFVADTGNGRIRRIAPDGTVSTLAGSVAAYPAFVDGTGAAASFEEPIALTVDATGNVYVVDFQAIRKVSPAGAVTTIAGAANQPGSADGPGATARFNAPSGIVVDAAGNLFVTDEDNGTIRRIMPDGTVSTFAGVAGSFGVVDGLGAAARFSAPHALALDAAGNLYVLDSAPSSPAASASGSLIRKITPAGLVTTVTIQAGAIANGAGPTTALFVNATAIVVDHSGNLAVSDLNNQVIGRIAPDGTLGAITGATGQSGSADGVATDARFSAPAGLAVDPAGNIVVADSGNSTVRKISPENVVTTIAGVAGASGLDDGVGPTARFSEPLGMARDSTGNLYVSSRYNFRLRKIAPDGTTTTFASTPGDPRAVNSSAAEASSNYPHALAVDANGNVIFSEDGFYDVPNGTSKPLEFVYHVIRKISPQGNFSTVGGSFTSFGFQDGPVADATFGRADALAGDGVGNIFVADSGAIRRIGTDGIVTTIAGSPLAVGSADGAGAAAEFSHPLGLAVDSSGTIYVADTGNHTIRKIAPGGAVTTLAGRAGESGSVDGVGATARFSSPGAMAVDGAGNLFVCDAGCTLRRVAPDGTVTTLGGKAGVIGSADGVGAAANFNEVDGIAVDPGGRIFVTDAGNNAIRAGQLVGPPTIVTPPQNQQTAPGGNAQFSVEASSVLPMTYQWQFNGAAVPGATGSTFSVDPVRGSDAGSYRVVVSNELGSVTSTKATLALTSSASASTSAGGGGGECERWFAATLGAWIALRRFSSRAAKTNR